MSSSLISSAILFLTLTLSAADGFAQVRSPGGSDESKRPGDESTSQSEPKTTQAKSKEQESATVGEDEAEKEQAPEEEVSQKSQLQGLDLEEEGNETANSEPTPKDEPEDQDLKREQHQGDEREKNKGAQDDKAPATPVKTSPPQARVLIDYEALPLTYHQWRVDIGLGPRLNVIPDPSFDLFSKGDVLASFSLRGGVTVFSQQRLSVSAGAEWDTSGAEGEARVQPTQLRLHRAIVGGEGRYHFHSRFYGYGGLGLGLVHVSSSLGDAAAVERLSLKRAAFTGSLRAGSAFRFVGEGDGRVRSPRGHFFVEAAYAYVSKIKLEYEVGEGGPLRPEPVDLGSLSLSGLQLTAGVLVSF